MSQVKDQPVALGDRALVEGLRGEQGEELVGARARMGEPGGQDFAIPAGRGDGAKRRRHGLPSGDESPSILLEESPIWRRRFARPDEASRKPRGTAIRSITSKSRSTRMARTAAGI